MILLSRIQIFNGDSEAYKDSIEKIKKNNENEFITPIETLP